ncbi:MAG TPA: DUF1223 domain-containing protein [Rhodobacteraceae bacterium]|nr:DUF1223 domain-containing protein [Paracoccaceae bacterium]
MNRLTAWIIGIWVALAGVAVAQSGPVVVELYTSQGCSSCPPADKLLGELAKRDDVIALSLHVDYWDYIGWKDVFASPQYTKRQHAYARAAGKRMVYTPQMVIEGQDHVVGTKPREVSRLIKSHAAAKSPVSLSVDRNGNQLTIKAQATGSPGKMVVQMVRFMDGQTVQIKRGENAGKALTYSNVVSEWKVLKEWDGKSPLTFTTGISGDDGCAIIIQKASHGPVLAAAKVR